MQQGFIVRHDHFDRIIQVQQRFVTLLTAMLIGGIESVLKSGIEQMRTITDQLCGVALLTKHLPGVVGATLVYRLPAVMRPTQNAGRKVGPMRYGRKTPHIAIGNLRRPLGGKPIQFRRPDRPLGPVAQIVVSEGVRDENDDIFVHDDFL
jgi:hypothetical protein